MNLLRNGRFEQDTVLLRRDSNDDSLIQATAAEHWTTRRYLDSALITTNLLPTTLPAAIGGGRMMHVCTTGLAELAQSFPRGSHGSTYVRAAAWVFVLRGKVSLGLGQGEWVRAVTTSTRVAEWEYLEGRNGVYPVEHFVIGSAVETMEAGACYYVADTLVQELSEAEWAAIASERRGLIDLASAPGAGS